MTTLPSHTCGREDNGCKGWRLEIDVVLVLCPALRAAPLSEKRSGEQSPISWDYSQKVVRTNEIAGFLIIM